MVTSLHGSFAETGVGHGTDKALVAGLLGMPPDDLDIPQSFDIAEVLILGGVAAGTKVAAKLKRADRSCEVTVLTKGRDISYAGCGLPYYVGDVAVPVD